MFRKADACRLLRIPAGYCGYLPIAADARRLLPAMRTAPARGAGNFPAKAGGKGFAVPGALLCEERPLAALHHFVAIAQAA